MPTGQFELFGQLLTEFWAVISGIRTESDPVEAQERLDDIDT